MPYDPATTSSPPERPDYQDHNDFPAESFIRERGPLHLLEAVYCDPCKARVINWVQLSGSHKLFPGCLLSHHYDLLARSAKVL